MVTHPMAVGTGPCSPSLYRSMAPQAARTKSRTHDRTARPLGGANRSNGSCSKRLQRYANTRSHVKSALSALTTEIHSAHVVMQAYERLQVATAKVEEDRTPGEEFLAAQLIEYEKNFGLLQGLRNTEAIQGIMRTMVALEENAPLKRWDVKKMKPNANYDVKTFLEQAALRKNGSPSSESPPTIVDTPVQLVNAL